MTTQNHLDNYDYSRIRYFQDECGVIWSGPHSPNDNMHWGKVDGSGAMVLQRSYRDLTWAEITPQQAARILKLRSEGGERCI